MQHIDLPAVQMFNGAINGSNKEIEESPFIIFQIGKGIADKECDLQ